MEEYRNLVGLDEQLVFSRNKHLNKFTGDCIHVATFKSFEDQFLIYLDVYTFQWILILRIYEPIDRTLLSECMGEEKGDIIYYQKENFKELEKSLNAIIFTDFEYEIRINTKRWWSFLPAWVYLESDFMHPTFLKYFQQSLDKNLDGIITDADLSENEKKYLDIWNGKTMDSCHTIIPAYE